MTTILDANGKPIDLNALREPQTARVGWLQREFDEHPARGITPAKLARLMVAAEQGDLVGQCELADDIEERDGHIHAELAKRRGAITGLDWEIEPPEGASNDEVKLAQQLEDWLQALVVTAPGETGGFELALSSMTDAILKGFSAQEMVWDYVSDGSGRKVQLPSLTWHPQRWFTASADRRRFMLRSHQLTDPTPELPAVAGEELQPLAWLLHVHPARTGYVTRNSLARVLFWPYLFKNFAVRDLAEFLEIYGLPIRMGKYPTGASDTEKLALLQAVTQIGHNAAGIMPNGMTIDLANASAGTEVPFAAMWDRLDAVESKVILGQTLTASEGQHGTQALGNVHNDVRMDIREDDARRVARAVTEQLLRPIVLLNVPGADPRRLPRLEFDTGEAEDLAAYADALPKLVGVGFKIPRSWAQDKLRIPEPEADEELLAAAAPPAAPNVGAAPGQQTDPNAPPGAKAAAADIGQKPGALADPQGNAAAAVPPKQQQAALAAQLASSGDLIDDLVAEQAAEWQPLLGPLIEPLLAEIEKAVAAGESLEAFAARLPDLIPRMDAQPVTAAIARAAFSARLAGEAGVNLDPQQEQP